MAFNLTNKSIYKFFPFPWTVSTVHVLVGTLYCGFAYLLGAKKASFGRVRILFRFKNECGLADQQRRTRQNIGIGRHACSRSHRGQCVLRGRRHFVESYSQNVGTCFQLRSHIFHYGTRDAIACHSHVDPNHCISLPKPGL